MVIRFKDLSSEELKRLDAGNIVKCIRDKMDYLDVWSLPECYRLEAEDQIHEYELMLEYLRREGK